MSRHPHPIALGRLAHVHHDRRIDASGLGDGTSLQCIVVERPRIALEAGVAVAGHARLTVFSDGATRFQGRLHARGTASYDCMAVFAVKDVEGRAYTASFSGRMHGERRDLEWDEWDMNDEIRRHWASIRAAATRGARVNAATDGALRRIARAIGALRRIARAIGAPRSAIARTWALPRARPPDGPPLRWRGVG